MLPIACERFERPWSSRYIITAIFFRLLPLVYILLHRNSNEFFKLRLFLVPLLKKEKKSNSKRQQRQCSTFRIPDHKHIFLQFGFYDQKLMDCDLKEKNCIETRVHFLMCFFCSLHDTHLFLLRFLSKWIHKFVYCTCVLVRKMRLLLHWGFFVVCGLFWDTQESHPNCRCLIFQHSKQCLHIQHCS